MTLMLALILIVTMIVPVSAASSIEEQMAANSAAWQIANAAGDKAACDALHAANVALAQQAAGNSGSASYDSASGTWNITTSSGSTITSSSSYDGGKTTTATYTTVTSSGSTSVTTDSTYTDSSIDAYLKKVVMTYNFGQGTKSVVLEETGTGTFEFPENAESPMGNRCVYIPVDTADGTYTLTFTVTAKNAAGEVLSDTLTSSVVVKGNMYEDDFTGDS